MRREPELAAARIEPMLAIAEEQALSFNLSEGLILRIWCDALTKGQCAENSCEAARKALCDLQALGQQLRLPFYSGLIAQCLATRGEFGAALAALDAALLHAKRTGETLCEPENHRLKGDLLLRLDPTAIVDAENCYWIAIELARLQDSKSLELRASARLARLWRAQGRRAAARDLLAPIYHWFTEGFDTLDLKEARALLEELGDPSVGRAAENKSAVGTAPPSG
jgi:predicted ATPase